MRKLVVATIASPLTLLCPALCAAQTTVSSNSSANIQTATASNGGPGDVTISSGVTLAPPGGTAVTVNSNNSVTNNGTISFNAISNTAAIGSTGGFSGTITNAGTITDNEPSAAVSGQPDGPLATGTNRFGINITGSGAFTGSISQTGTITIVGTNSAGIAVSPQLAGSLSDTGAVTVTGDGSYGIHLGAVTGSVSLTGAVSTSGAGNVGVALDGDVGGAVTLGSAVTATGFYNGATVPATPDAYDLAIGGPAVRIAGNVAGGVSVASGGALTSYGSAPALLIGSAAEPITLGVVSGGTSGLSIAGAVTGSGVNQGIGATALQIGGLGQPVTITGGITIASTVSAVASLAPATAIAIGAGVSTPTLTNSGTIAATGGSGSFAGSAVLIAAGASVPALVNSGTITAASVGSTGTAAAIQDRSGTLTSITNAGTIGASLTGSYTAAQAVAIDLSANTSGVSIANSGTGTPTITGSILTGSGSDTVAVPVGTINSAIALGGGNNTVAVSGTGAIVGSVDFGGGAGSLTMAGNARVGANLTFGAGSSMTLGDTATFAGGIVQNGNALALSVNGGSFDPTNTGTIALRSLNVGATGAIQVNIDPAAGTATTYQVSGTATLASGAGIRLNLADFLGASQTYTIITAGSLSNAGTLSVTGASLPYVYTASLTDSATAVTLSLAPKTAAQLGLNQSGSAAYPAIFHEAGIDTKLQGAFLAVTDAGSFGKLYSELLPDHSGALYLSGAEASREVAAMAGDPATPRSHGGPISAWLGQTAGYSSKGQDATEAYHRSFFGLAGGAELGVGPLGAVGVEVDWSYLDADDPLNDNKVSGNLTELGAYWRASLAGLRLYARGAYGFFNTASSRALLDPSATATSDLYIATASWSGHTEAVNGGAAFEAGFGRFVLRPAVSADYFRLEDGAHAETGGGPGFDLAVAARTSESWSAKFAASLGYKLTNGALASRLEVELGDRERLSGSVANTVVSYADGQTYTLAADALRFGPEAAVRLSLGNGYISAIGQLSAQKTEGQVEAGFSAGVRLRL